MSLLLSHTALSVSTAPFSYFCWLHFWCGSPSISNSNTPPCSISFFFFSLSSDSEKLTSKRFCCLVSSCYYSILMNSAFPLHLFFLSSLFFFLAILHSSAYLNYFFFFPRFSSFTTLACFSFLFRTIRNERFFFLFLAEWITQTIVVSVNVQFFFFSDSFNAKHSAASEKQQRWALNVIVLITFEWLFWVFVCCWRVHSSHVNEESS